MTAFRPLPLGTRIPDSVHAVSFSLPTMREVRGYEEKEPAITRQLTSGYPRFLVHPFARELAAHLELKRAALGGKTLWLTSSSRMAAALQGHLEAWRPNSAKIFAAEELSGVFHDRDPEMWLRTKLFLQHVGGFISSRAAEEALVRRGLHHEGFPEETVTEDALGRVTAELQRAVPEAAATDIFVSNCGMSAMFAAFQAIAEEQAPRQRTIWVQLGWLYIDTIAILKKFTGAPSNYVYLRDIFDLDTFEQICRAHGHRIAGVVAELPSNPLIQTADVPRLSELCRAHGIRLVLDTSVTSVYNLRVLEFADIVVGSLTKYTASDGDLTAGVAMINPAGPAAGELRGKVANLVEPLYPRDLARLAREIQDTREVLACIHKSTTAVAEFLAGHPAVRDVYWALHPHSRENYLRVARCPDATGGMITFTLRGPLEKFYDRLVLPKGPSFGMKTTLICPFMYLAHYDLVSTPAGLAELAASKLDPDLLRLCVGTEATADIVAELEAALA